jgi:acyl carrier protein
MKLVAEQQNKTLKPLTDDTVLLDCGLDSLCFAILVTRLEDELGFDPFATADEVQFPVTFGDFVQFYERAAA